MKEQLTCPRDSCGNHGCRYWKMRWKRRQPHDYDEAERDSR